MLKSLANCVQYCLLILSFSSVGIVTGCGMVQDTKDMKKTTEEMRDTSRRIEGESMDLAENTKHLRNDLTAKESFFMVKMNLDELFGRDSTGLDRANRSEPTMLVYAKATILAMLNQYWKGEFRDQEIASLDERFALHLELLFGRCLEHIPRTFEINPTPTADGSYKAIASLGAHMAVLGDDFAATLKRLDLPRLSMYDVVVEALRNRGQDQRIELLPRSAAMVLKFKREAIFMLQLRHNYLPMMVVGRMTDFQDRNMTSRMGTVVFGMSQDMGVNDARGSTSVDQEQLNEWIDWLSQAVQTRKDLSEIGIAPEYNSQFMSIVQGLDFGRLAIMSLPEDKLTSRQKLFRDFALVYGAAATKL